ncbi:DUF4132 domain-containing protein [Butyrivibrio sp. MC2013]|uniref:DUF4132 domain-containing protein n=1 Tax=Butyrivibrio sp. MC2013 TaxID=1280686 RepID=UPI000403AF7E|nr:DUF4132 domain-containing protein [Butyrivibrio sp. MC2013]
MRQISALERTSLERLGREYRKKHESMTAGRFNNLPRNVRDFVLAYRKGNKDNDLYKDFAEHIRSGGVPSEYIRKSVPAILTDYIDSRHEKHLLYTIDHLHERIYQTGYYRRSMRTSDPHILADAALRKIEMFGDHDYVAADICDYLSDRISDEELGFKLYDYFYQGDCVADIIAAEIDFGNEKLTELITDCVNGDNDVTFDRPMICGILASHSRPMYELLGRLLIAARLQEGLRQSICEAMDEGTPEAFIYLTGIINENNLIRFSAVKRAYATWMGFWDPDAAKLERMGNRMAEHVYACLTDDNKRQEYLDSEDSLRIHIALWSIGFYEMRDMACRIADIAKSGSRHQILTASYSMNLIQNTFYDSAIAKELVRDHKDDLEIMTGYMGFFMGDVASRIRDKQCELSAYFESKEEAELYYDILKGIYQQMHGRKVSFDPFIFEWNKSEITKGSLLIRMAYIAAALRSDDRMDEICGMLGNAEVYERDNIMQHLLDDPGSSIQRAFLITSLCDRSDMIRRDAYKLVDSIRATLTDEDYLTMEDMLRFKASDARAVLINLLMDQQDEKLEATVLRLLEDKKEEKRIAALDIVMNLSKDEKRRELFERCGQKALTIAEPSGKEQILLDNIKAALGGDKEAKEEQDSLYGDEDIYEPGDLSDELCRKAVRLFMDYFPDSELGRALYPDEYKKGILGSLRDMLTADTCDSFKMAAEDLRALGSFVELHEKDEYLSSYGEKTLVGASSYLVTRDRHSGENVLALKELWLSFLRDRNVDKYRFYRIYLLTKAPSYMGYAGEGDRFADDVLNKLYGNGFSEQVDTAYTHHVETIVRELLGDFVPRQERNYITIAYALYLLKCLPASELYRKARADNMVGITSIERLEFEGLDRSDKETAKLTFPLTNLLYRKHKSVNPYKDVKYGFYRGAYYHGESYPIDITPMPKTAIYAGYRKILTDRQLFKYLFEECALGDTLEYSSAAVMAVKEKDAESSTRHMSYRALNVIKDLSSEADEKYLSYVAGVCSKVIDKVLSVELRRGDSPTAYSAAISRIGRIYGADNFVAILTAIGKDKLVRSAYYPSNSKLGALSDLLSVCVPLPDDNAERLRSLVKGSDISEKRLVEASLYSNAWLDIMEEYLGWEGYVSGCYYFIAHMDEFFDDKKMAVIARYTPLSAEKLRMGAFDIDWFRSAYASLGQKRFEMIYDAAKYISDGSKHSRARKYADAATGKYRPDELKAIIMDKRNKDFLMAYPLIPIENEDDLVSRYLYLQQFLKESRKFGAQRSASEKAAVEIAMENLSLNAGFSDVTRLTLRMETRLMEEGRHYLEDKVIGDVTVRLQVDEEGKTSIIVVKAGKTLKSVPAAIKKDEYIKKLTETKKSFTEQYRRTRQMFENAMENEELYSAGELAQLKDNPVAWPIIKNLVFMTVSDKKLGFLDNCILTDYEGNETVLSPGDELKVAHPFHLYQDGHWTKYQRCLFDKKLVQPFKQVFRELYVKTEEEMGVSESRRYAGNQIQPKKTMAALRSRRWICDVEDGLQKIYYKDDIVATIYALADWFSPSEIEAPTLEWVAFYDRKTNKRKAISEVPDIIFSEVMRDVDMAVSVAHAGGVDPETSHSTIEMRAAVIEMTLPLFGLSNVTVEKSHAFIEGHYGNYSVHLGSAVVHKLGGAMINILPVHSQHRGKLFLPFADDDPKTAEVLTKVLFLAKDSKIKDPSILSQIRG